MKNLKYIIISCLVWSCSLEEIPEVSTAIGTTEAGFAIADRSNNGYAPTTIRFSNTSSNADNYEWNFDDPTSGAQENTSTEAEPSHTFQSPGIYDVQLTARNSTSGAADQFSMSVTVAGINTFRQSYQYSANSNNYGVALAQSPNGGFAITGSTGTDLLLILTDPAGRPISGSPRIFDGGAGYDYGSAILPIPSGGYAIMGSSYNGSDSDVWLILTDANGNQLAGSPKRFDIGGLNESASDITLTQSGGFAITGEMFNGNNYDAFLLLTDAAGNPLPGFPKIFDGGGYEDDAGQSIITTADGGFAIAGRSWNDRDMDAWLILTDENGMAYPGSPRRYDSGNGSDAASSIVQTTEGGFAMIGYSENGPYDDVWLILTDGNGNELAGSRKRYDIAAGVDRGSDIINTSSGGFAMTGSSSTGAGQGMINLFWLQTDRNGNAFPNSPKRYEVFTGMESSGAAILQTPDGGFVMTGNTWDDNNDSKALLIKTNSEGELN